MNSIDEELVSICIPIFNREDFLVETINSIQNQSYKNIEIIIVDNNSTDSSYQLVLKKFAKIKNIRIYKNEKNIGYNQNYNKCIQLAKGKYVGIFHSDDLYHRSIVENSIKLLSSKKKIGFVCSYGEKIDLDGKVIGDYKLPKNLRQKNKSEYNFEEIFYTILNVGNVITTSTVITKKEVLKEVGFFDEKFRATADYDLWLRILKKYNLGIINKKMVKWREHDNQISKDTIRNWVNRPPEFPVYEKHAKNFDSFKKYLDLYKSKRLIYNSIQLNANKEFKLSTNILISESNLKYKLKLLILKYSILLFNRVNFAIFFYIYKIFRKIINIRKKIKIILTKNIFKFFYLDFWIVGIIESDINSLMSKRNLDLLKINFLKQNNKKLSFIADPFFFNYKKKNIIVAEEFNFYSGMGKLCFYKISNNELVEIKKVNTNSKNHYSYPYTFIDNNKKFIIAECFQRNNISLLEINDELEIVSEKVLVSNFKGVDTSIIKVKNLYWLFSTKYESNKESELYLWYSENIFDDWIPHKNNPIKYSDRGARGAGRITFLDNKIIRPTQNNSLTYGGSILFYEIKQLNENKYEEFEIFEIFPPEGFIGVHNIDYNNSEILLDFKLRRFNLFALFFKLFQIIKLKLIHEKY